MVLELGLRFRPQTTDNQEEYAATVTLLAQDVADVPPHLLQQAIGEWVRTKRFLPRASELIELAQLAQRGNERGTDSAVANLQAHCDKLNAMSWVRQSGKPYMISERHVDGQLVRFVDRAA
jgi:hypothetical protein